MRWFFNKTKSRLYYESAFGYFVSMVFACYVFVVSSFEAGGKNIIRVATFLTYCREYRSLEL
ncbi:hypothetical protein [Capnocytophaga catalasegens]|uniref:hypothetical protein n=1 Tax=Capnocytophaga catalasegens TaxID=1004260 RepID=UPI00223144C8|nr:hypothetical protein [Capnocytophaga catalasegens]